MIICFPFLFSMEGRMVALPSANSLPMVALPTPLNTLTFVSRATCGISYMPSLFGLCNCVLLNLPSSASATTVSMEQHQRRNVNVYCRIHYERKSSSLSGIERDLCIALFLFGTQSHRPFDLSTEYLVHTLLCHSEKITKVPS